MKRTAFGIFAVVCAAGAAAQPYDGLQVNARVFNDYPASTLNINNAYPASLSIEESNFGAGSFANRHMAWASEDAGATASDFDYGDGFDFAVTMNFDASPTTGREAGFMVDLFGFGFFGALGNGEIAAFGSFLPFHSFGNVYANATDVRLRMIYTPGAGENVLPASTMEYIIDIGGGPISSGALPITNLEGGIPSAFNTLVGVGIQSQGAPGGYSNVLFTDFDLVPAPGTAALALGGVLLGARRRRA